MDLSRARSRLTIEAGRWEVIIDQQVDTFAARQALVRVVH